MVDLVLFPAALFGIFLRTNNLFYLVFDLPEFFHLRINGRKFRLPRLVFLFQTVMLLAPCSDRQFPILKMRL